MTRRNRCLIPTIPNSRKPTTPRRGAGRDDFALPLGPEIFYNLEIRWACRWCPRSIIPDAD